MSIEMWEINKRRLLDSEDGCSRLLLKADNDLPVDIRSYAKGPDSSSKWERQVAY